MIDAQLNVGYESSSGFRDAFEGVAKLHSGANSRLLRRFGFFANRLSPKDYVDLRKTESALQSSNFRREASFAIPSFAKIMGAPPSGSCQKIVLAATWIDSPLGPLLAIGDDRALYLLEFVDRRGLEREIERMRRRYAIVPGRTAPLLSIERELAAYFAGHLKTFATPLHLEGSPFQKQVWQALLDIPYGETRSYADLARAIDRPTAFRAVANANGCNQLSLVIPCHRVINSNGALGGYGGGIHRKQWLLKLEAP